jgi:hypothetical protein
MRYLVFVCLLLPLAGFNQIWDDFDDGNFTQNPSWGGDINEFKINDDNQLQLDSEGTKISYLITQFGLQQETEWRFWIKQSFSPSANNNGRFYLASDQMNLEGPQNGYFLQFGESGSADAIELYRQNGDDLTLVCRGTDGLIASSFELWMRVRKDAQGNWTIETDATGNGAYLIDATGTDNFVNSSSWLGVYCKYTSSNSSNFYFDDVYAGPYVVDTEPPQLLQVNALNANTLEILFNEALDMESAENIQNYFVSDQIQNPLIAILDQENPALIRLTFDREFPNGEMLSVSIENISDLAGNVISPIQESFVFFTPAVHDILINEIMADPTPTVGLPEWEYLELFNRTQLPVDLSGWKLQIGNAIKEIENATIEPGGFLILGDEDAATDFTFFGPFYGFSSIALTNAGQTLVLMNPEGNVISHVSYTDGWYRDANKQDGGWSLEQIDPDNPCGGINNWVAAVNQNGGTPGAENSVLGENPDMVPPYASRIEITSPASLILHFSEPMDSVLLFNNTAYEVSDNIGNPLSATPAGPAYQSVELIFAGIFENAVVYHLTILDENLTDCAGNKIDRSVTVSFGLPDEITENDIVINEVLFNPKDDFVNGVDFVEIYNRSDKILDLNNLLLATEDEDTGELKTPKEISGEGFLFFPGEYLVLTTDPGVVQSQYFSENPDGFIKMEGLPSYNNDQGIVVLATKGFIRIDRMEYTESMQYPLLTDFNGVSLERIHYDRPSDDPTNWHSAGEDAGFATPAYQNSQFGMIIETTDPITIDPEIFSPDSDGHEDVLNIYYQFETGGNNCSINIYDSRGRLVRSLVNNQFLGTRGLFSWDGLTDDNQKAAIGIYVIFVDVFDLEGKRQQYKKTAVLGTRF